MLVVDDEETIRSFTKSALAPCGYEVIAAGSGPEAVRLLEGPGRHIDLVLLDLAMPGMDGLQTLDLIRKTHPNMTVIICSGFGDMEVAARFEGKQIAGFLPKPYTVKQLARKVKECIRP